MIATRFALFLTTCALAWGLAPSAALAQPVLGGVDLFELHPGGPTHLVMESTWVVGEGVPRAALKLDAGSDTRPAFDDATVQLLWLPEVAPGVSLALGARHDLRPGSNLTHAVAGIEAQVLPWLSGEHYAFLSQHGDVTGSAKLQADLPLTGALTLQPRAELGWAAHAIPAELLGAGITDVTLSVRLRHRIGAGFDVYVGGIHEAVVGASGTIARANGNPTKVTRGVIGAGFAF